MWFILGSIVFNSLTVIKNSNHSPHLSYPGDFSSWTRTQGRAPARQGLYLWDYSSSPRFLWDSVWSVTQAGFTVGLPATSFRRLGSRACSTTPDLLWGVLSIYTQNSTNTTSPVLALTNTRVISAPGHWFSQMDYFQWRSKQPTLFL